MSSYELLDSGFCRYTTDDSCLAPHGLPSAALDDSEHIATPCTPCTPCTPDFGPYYPSFSADAACIDLFGAACGPATADNNPVAPPSPYCCSSSAWFPSPQVLASGIAATPGGDGQGSNGSGSGSGARAHSAEELFEYNARVEEQLLAAVGFTADDMFTDDDGWLQLRVDDDGCAPAAAAAAAAAAADNTAEQGARAAVSDAAAVADEQISISPAASLSSMPRPATAAAAAAAAASAHAPSLQVVDQELPEFSFRASLSSGNGSTKPAYGPIMMLGTSDFLSDFLGSVIDLSAPPADYDNDTAVVDEQDTIAAAPGLAAAAAADDNTTGGLASCSFAFDAPGASATPAAAANPFSVSGDIFAAATPPCVEDITTAELLLGLNTATVAAPEVIVIDCSSDDDVTATAPVATRTRSKQRAHASAQQPVAARTRSRSKKAAAPAAA